MPQWSMIEQDHNIDWLLSFAVNFVKYAEFYKNARRNRMGNFIKLTFEIQAEYVKQVWHTIFMLWEYLEISVKLQMVYAMYTRCSREQPGVAERSDADDRLRRALNAKLWNMFTENICGK